MENLSETTAGPGPPAVGRRSIVERLALARRPKTPPLCSRWLVVLSLLCLGVGYGPAVRATVLNVIVLVLPAVALVVVTYFLFTQSGVWGRLQRNKPFYYLRPHPLTVSQLVFRLKDNARVLSASAAFMVEFEKSDGVGRGDEDGETVSGMGGGKDGRVDLVKSRETGVG